MESPPCEASSQLNPSLCGLVELPPKKRVSEREKATVICESSEAQNGSPQEKASFDDQTQPLIAYATPEIISPKKEEQESDEPTFNLVLHLNQVAEKGESSSSHPPGFPSPLAAPPLPSSRQQPAAICKFCGQQFSTTQALGGHQNAHKQEREIQRAMKAAHEFATNPFIVGTTRPPPLFHASHYGPQIRYSPYHHGFAHRGWLQPRSNNFSHPRMSLAQAGPPGFARTLDGFIRPYYVQASGPIRTTFMRNSNSNSFIGPPNLMNPLLQARENEHNLGMKQCVESSTDLSLSLTSSETEEHRLPPKQNISSEPDLTLKL